MSDLRDRVLREVAKVVVGQDRAVAMALTTIIAGGHVLLEGVPGTAKTLLANALARAMSLEFKRIQFTPDMLPSDVTGTMTLRGGELSFRPGPLFANVVLGDEINRTPPKTQAALLEAMQESQVTVDGATRPLPDPFVVLATQNPIDYEGTYPLPEAQLDRFMMKIDVGYPAAEQEAALLLLDHAGSASSGLEKVHAVASADELRQARAEATALTITPETATYIASVVRATREFPSVELGASPRAAVAVLSAARALSWLNGGEFVTADDVQDVAPPVLRHRILVRPEAELDNYRAEDAVRAALAAVPVPR